MKGTVFKLSWVSLVLLALIGGFFTVATVPVSPAQGAACFSTFTNKTTADGLGGNNVYGVYADGSNVYAATFAGLSISADGGTSFTNRTTADGLGSNTVLGVYADGSAVYAATSGGLSISANGGTSFTNRTTADGLGSNTVVGVYADGSAVYAATNGGLSISTDGGTSFTNRTTADGLGSNTVVGVYADGSNVYAATGGGLSISANGGTSFTNRTTADGLGSNNVSGVYADGSNVYAATDAGLSISADCVSSSATSSSGSPGIPGIYLYVEGTPGRLVEGTPVYHGSFAIAPNSIYRLSVESRDSQALPKTVLSTDVTNGGGHVEQRIELGALAPGSYKIVMMGYHELGYPLVLTNHIVVDGAGKFVSVSAESLQPILN